MSSGRKRVRAARPTRSNVTLTESEMTEVMAETEVENTNEMESGEQEDLPRAGPALSEPVSDPVPAPEPAVHPMEPPAPITDTAVTAPVTVTHRRGRPGKARPASTSSTGAVPSTGSPATSATAGVPASSPAITTHGDRPASASVEPVPPDPQMDVHPLRPGYCLLVRYRDSSLRLAKIIEVAPSPSSSAAGVAVDWRYYVHYLDFNRRMDEWIDLDRIAAMPSTANVLEQQRASKGSTEEALRPLSLPLSPSSALVEHLPQSSAILTTVAELEHDEHEGMDEQSLLEHEIVTKVKNIRFVQLGRHIMECWYFSPFPREYFPHGYADCLYFCEYSLRFFRSKEELLRYQSKPGLHRHPPGNEIYRDDTLSMFELDGAIERFYCQNLCYFAKLFLDHKTLYWDVDPFLFYVLCTRDERGFHPVGYFSKEKYSELGYNLACILTFPFVQRQGYGRFLIEFSYELSKKEEKYGSPEKPLSDLGAIGYRSYWASAILKVLRTVRSPLLSIVDITSLTSIQPEDVVSTLVMLGLLRKVESENGGSSPGQDKSGEVMLIAHEDVLNELSQRFPENRHKVDANKLHWTPFYVMEPKKDKWSLYYLRNIAGAAAAAVAAATTSTSATATAAGSTTIESVPPLIHSQ